MNFKKITACLLVLALALSLAACGKTDGADGSAAADGGADAAQPAVDNSAYTINYGDFFDQEGNWLNLKAADYVTLPADYNGLSIPAEETAVSQEELQEQIDYLLASFPEVSQVTDRAVADNDSVNIDYVGSVDGVEFEGGSTGGSGTTVTIGVTNYIDDFLEQLIGHTPGETFNVEVTFPEDYGKEELNGKDAVFVTTINYIEESKTPEYTDEFVAANLSSVYDVSTVNELNSYLRQEMTKSKAESYLLDYLLENSTFAQELPAILTDYQKADMLSYYAQYATMYGVTLEEFISSYLGGQSIEELFQDESVAASLENYAKQFLIYQAISDENGLKVNDAVITSYLQDVTGSEDVTAAKEQYDPLYVAFNCRSYLANKLVKDNAQYELAQ